MNYENEFVCNYQYGNYIQIWVVIEFYYIRWKLYDNSSLLQNVDGFNLNKTAVSLNDVKQRAEV